MNHKRTKHINVKYYKIRQWVVDEKVINLVKIVTKQNPADMMTKIISVDKFRASLNFIQFSKGKVKSGLLRGSHVRSQK